MIALAGYHRIVRRDVFLLELNATARLAAEFF
jgi:hypothetical protein